MRDKHLPTEEPKPLHIQPRVITATQHGVSLKQSQRVSTQEPFSTAQISTRDSPLQTVLPEASPTQTRDGTATHHGVLLSLKLNQTSKLWRSAQTLTRDSPWSTELP